MKTLILSLGIGIGCLPLTLHAAEPEFRMPKPAIPKTWEDGEIASLELPLAEPGFSPKHVSADYYYRIPVRPIFKSYPIYHPNQEPPGYFEKLRREEPEVL